jgi:hypothetical protein
VRCGTARRVWAGVADQREAAAEWAAAAEDRRRRRMELEELVAALRREGSLKVCMYVCMYVYR